jgi:orotidine-5'-phosphate decarboxylase
MTRAELIRQIQAKQSFLCVGLDPDPAKMPPHLLRQPNAVLEFNRNIIQATRDFCVAYKPNLAFYESMGPEGWAVLKQTLEFIPGEHLIIADAKRGDIGNTSRQYAKAFFETLNADALTIAPYMGADSIQPFLESEGKWVVLLALTSNKGSQDFQMQKMADGRALYETVLETSVRWGTPDQLMFVVGATHPDYFQTIRRIAPDHFLLVPGVGAQGGSLEEVCRYGMNREVGLLINVSRGVLYAGTGTDYAEAAGRAAQQYQQQMARILSASPSVFLPENDG